MRHVAALTILLGLWLLLGFAGGEYPEEDGQEAGDRAAPRRQDPRTTAAQGPRRPGNIPRARQYNIRLIKTQQKTAELERKVESLSTNMTEMWTMLEALSTLVSDYHPRGEISMSEGGGGGGTSTTVSTTEEDNACPPDPWSGIVPDDRSCMAGPEEPVCSGRGYCECGVCMCYPRADGTYTSGQYCECDNYSCERYNGQICGGPERGQCSCGQCQCYSEYYGVACECPTSQDSCVAPGEDLLCSGQGYCECGQCHCNEGYSGVYCEESPTSDVCDDLRECVVCDHLSYSSDADKPDFCSPDTAHCPRNVRRRSKGATDTHCRLYITFPHTECYIYFRYKQTRRRINLYVEPNTECP